MTTEFVFVFSTLLLIVVLFFVFEIQRQKTINAFLLKRVEILSEINLHKSHIQQRKTNLNRYDFTIYNLEDALAELEDVVV